ncbi:Membrane proteinase PrsW, cleaves anti-sigma factor RsiW, M82 family [Butyrivibrio proteoclasticus]|uniref:Membrane proteinase PrsW, cleaves anti-sigma factor RsiW, M82 family n=1 Tax=Butyrivibrio proteoclasticus TaxID=43305 RepID=A0A1I5SST6_9FIRM|nr:PrsW family glutamic-type intramembrane protease [Butyrivibrio proteoclasticus]SFP73805.1 Membrane proteinase PrsW, cleaves anti-sigma factor RsiW, M82 family [Butyrivibrio proteoclasticus]
MSTLALLAVLPAIVLLVVIYRADNIEKEPFSLMAKVFGLGALTTISAMILEEIGLFILSFFFYTPNALYTFFEMFCVVALAEETGKYFVLKKATWKNKEFNFSFDGIVYSVCASLGFATLENILYVFQGGFSTAVMRAVTAVPGHCIFGIFMGIYYGIAKGCELRGDEKGKKDNLNKALLVPIFLHGFYDFSCSLEYDGMFLIFILLEIFMTVKAIKMVKKMSKEDKPLGPEVQMAAPTIDSIGSIAPVVFPENIQPAVESPANVTPESVTLNTQSAPENVPPVNPNPVFTAESIDPSTNA